MDLVPVRKSLLSSTTTLLREGLNAGEWVGQLPGERKLCDRMQVGRDTLRLALKQLEREGMIGKGDPGKRRPILVRPKKFPSHATRTGTINYLTPHRLQQMTETGLAEIDMLRVKLAESGFRLEIVNSSVFALDHPARRILKLVEEHQADAWILHQSTKPMQRCFLNKGIPCLLHGLPHEGIDLPFVDLDYLAVGRHAGGFLSRRGHERVVYLPTKAQLRGLGLAEEGLRSVIKGPLQVYPDPGNLAGLISQIDRMLENKNRPTAVVATRSRQVLTLLTRLGQLGLRVPKDMSIILLDHNPYLDHLVPSIACYQIDVVHAAKTLVRKVLELAGTGATTRKIPALMPDFIEGQSVEKIEKI